MHLTRVIGLLAAIALTFSLAACGGSGPTDAEAVSPGASAVQGIATPSSVSVVTAKNAN
ncbi:MAG: hypothetical protein IV094_14565 [Vitreoscilla sp.]|nr:hypothetical protein [Vitreoscilla sp.]